MRLSINRDLLKGNQVVGVHLRIMPDGTWISSIVVLEKNKNLVRIASSCEKLHGASALAEKLTPAIPVVLSVEGRGVVHRLLPATGINNAVLQVLPNARPDDFCVQMQDIDEGSCLVSVIRQDAIREIMAFFREKGYFICNMCLGPLSLSTLWPLLDERPEEVIADSLKIIMHQGRIKNIDSVSQSFTGEYTVRLEKINASLIIPYANALSYFLNGLEILTFSEDLSRKNRDDFFYKQLFRVSAVFLLGLLFVVLLINFVLFDGYNRKYRNASMQYNKGLELVDRLNSLKSEFKLKETLMQESGISYYSGFSYYADRVASLVPRQLVLTKLDINPSAAKLKADKEFMIERNSIRIAGECTASLYLDNWMETLRREHWIKRMEIIQYQQESIDVPGKFVIRIEI